MSRRLSLSFLSAIFVYCLSNVFTPSALAAPSCDVNACIGACQKRCPTPGCMCAPNCMQSIDKRKKSGQCK